MGIIIELHREGRVILQIYSDPLDMNDIVEQRERLVIEVLDHATRPVHTVVDALQVTRAPTNLISRGMQSLKQVHPMGGEIVVVTANPLLNRMSEIIKQLTRHYKMHVFKTMEQAWDHIDRILAEEDKLVQK